MGPRITRLLIVSGLLGPLLFVAVFLIEGATRPGYSVWHNTVSQLALGPRGWLQVANFYACGLLSLCFAAGLRRALNSPQNWNSTPESRSDGASPYDRTERLKPLLPGGSGTWAPILLAAFGLSLIAAGVFVTDPGLGYPPGSQAKGLQSLAGWFHWLASLVACAAAAAAAFVLARRFDGDPGWRGWRSYSMSTGVLILLFFAASNAASMLDDSGALPAAPVGLLQRLSIGIGCAWIVLLALRLLQLSPASGQPGKLLHDPPDRL